MLLSVNLFVFIAPFLRPSLSSLLSLVKTLIEELHIPLFAEIARNFQSVLYFLDINAIDSSFDWEQLRLRDIFYNPATTLICVSIPTNSISTGNGKLTRKYTRNEFQIYICSICMDIAIRVQIMSLSIFGVLLICFLKKIALFPKKNHCNQFYK